MDICIMNDDTVIWTYCDQDGIIKMEYAIILSDFWKDFIIWKLVTLKGLQVCYI